MGLKPVTHLNAMIVELFYMIVLLSCLIVKLLTIFVCSVPVGLYFEVDRIGALKLLNNGITVTDKNERKTVHKKP